MGKRKKKEPTPIALREWGSPIELKLRNALCQRAAGIDEYGLTDYSTSTTTIVVAPDEHDELHVSNWDEIVVDEKYKDWGAGSESFSLFGGVWIATYRVDFLFVHDETGVALALECDGHEFHERSKEKASSDRARDRALLRLGVPTARFTGSDVFHAADDCAKDAYDTLLALVRRSGARARADLDDKVVTAWHDGGNNGYKAGIEAGREEGAKTMRLYIANLGWSAGSLSGVG